MKYFTECDSLKKDNLKQTIVSMSLQEAQIIYSALEAYVKANKRKTNAKKLLEHLSEYWEVW